MNVELWDTVFIHQSRENREGTTRFRDNSNRNGGTDTHLPILNLEIVEEGVKHVLRANSLGDVTERTDCGTSDCLLVRSQHLKEFKADSHPFLGRDELGSSISNSANLCRGETTC